MAIELTRLVIEDLTTTYDMRNDPDIMKWCRQHDVLHWHNHNKWFDAQAKDETMTMYAIRIGGWDIRKSSLVSNRPALGVCGLTGIDYVNSRAEFSLYIGKDNQGQGYGEEALIKLFDKGFNHYNLNLIWGESFDGNPAIAMFEKVGMKKDGIRRNFYYREGKYIDAILYSITKKEFNKNG